MGYCIDSTLFTIDLHLAIHCCFTCWTTLLAGCSPQLHSPDLSWEAILIAVGLTGHVITSMATLSMPVSKPSYKSLTNMACPQHVHSPTRPSSGHRLHLVFASHPTVIQACHVVPSISDHDTVLFEVKCPPKPPPKILQYHKADFDGLGSQGFWATKV